MVKNETKAAALALTGLCIAECIEKDFLLKPIFCTVFCGLSTYYTGKGT
jgi:hypothetical protein